MTGRLFVAMAILGLLGSSLAACAGGTASPQPGAAFEGPIEIHGKANGGTISFTISVDGKNLTAIGVTLNDVDCPGMLTGKMGSISYYLYPVSNGKIHVNSGSFGTLEGRFTSPTEASGTIDLTFPAEEGRSACELGEWNWEAEVQQGAEWPWDDLALYPDGRNLSECSDWSPEAHMLALAEYPRVEAWCFTTSSTMEEVSAFYQDALAGSEWVVSGSDMPMAPEGNVNYWKKGEAEMLVITISPTAGEEVGVNMVRGWNDE